MYDPASIAEYNIAQIVRRLKLQGIKPDVIRKALTDAAEGLA